MKTPGLIKELNELFKIVPSARLAEIVIHCATLQALAEIAHERNINSVGPVGSDFWPVGGPA